MSATNRAFMSTTPTPSTTQLRMLPSPRTFSIESTPRACNYSVSTLKFLVIFAVNVFKVVSDKVLFSNFNRIMDLRKDRKRSLKVLEQQEAQTEIIEATKKRYVIMLGLIIKNTRFNINIFFVDDAKGTPRLTQPSDSLPQYGKRKPSQGSQATGWNWKGEGSQKAPGDPGQGSQATKEHHRIRVTTLWSLMTIG